MSGLMQRPFVALGLLAMGMAVIPLNDAFIKLMSDRLPLAEIVFVRGVLALLIMAVFSRGISSMLKLEKTHGLKFQHPVLKTIFPEKQKLPEGEESTFDGIFLH